MYEIAITILTTVLSGLLLWFIKEYVKLKTEKENKREQEHKEELKKQELRDDLLLGVARVLLMDKMQTALDRGYTTQDEYEVVEELYKPYILDGGNGVVKHLFEDKYNRIAIKKNLSQN
jgi:hypothetical protein